MAYKTFANGFPLPASDLNNYLMNQSVIVFASAAERSSTLTSPTEGMITYLEDTDTVEVYNGTAWTDINDNTAAIPKSTVTAAGDLIVADGTSSVTNLAAGADGSLLTVDTGSPSYLAPGTDGQVLTLTSGAPAWEDAAGGGGMTEITSGTLSGTSLNITSIPQTYKVIRLELTGWSMSSNDRPSLRLNNDSGNDYSYVGIATNFNSILWSNSTSALPFAFHDVNTGNGSTIIDVQNYTNASNQKIVVNAQSAYVNTGIQQIASNSTGFYANSAPITQINLFAFASFDSGTYKLWGVS